jgi:hypothetical protein
MKTILFLLVIVFVSFSATRWVDSTLVSDITNGTYSILNRDNSGNSGNAYNSVYAAVLGLSAGDTIQMRKGTYYECNIYIGRWTHGEASKYYTIMSYPGEWAIVDGKHDYRVTGKDTALYKGYIFYGTSNSGQQGYIRFQNFEITGGGFDTSDVRYNADGGGVVMRADFLHFRGMYIHNNYGNMNNNNAGLRLEKGTANGVFEYNYFRANGDVKPDSSEGSTSSCNLMFFADYAYEKLVVLTNPGTGFALALYKNDIHHNLFDSDAKNGYYTITGYKQKGMQRLTGYVYCDRDSVSDSLPNDNSLEAYGDKIHHNVFLNQPLAIEVDQDYAQVYNNVIYRRLDSPYIQNAIQGRDANSDRRGPHRLCVYNNTIIGNNSYGILYHPVPQGWTGVVPIANCYIFNNIVDSAKTAYNFGKIGVRSDGVTASGGYPVADIHIERNYYYRGSNDSMALIHLTKYNNSELKIIGDTNYYQTYDGANLLYTETYKTVGTHALDIPGKTIADGGIGGSHPYLAGVTIPSYVGATDPADDKWVDTVLALSGLGDDGFTDTTVLKSDTVSVIATPDSYHLFSHFVKVSGTGNFSDSTNDTCKIVVTSDTVVLSAVFTDKPADELYIPTITSIIPDSCPVNGNKKIAINGTNFLPTYNFGYVHFGNINATINYWSNTIDTVIVPTTLTRGLSKIYLMNDSLQIDSSKTFFSTRPGTLTYVTSPLICTENIAISNDTVSFQYDSPDSFTIYPVLPTGLSITKIGLHYGQIYGTPTLAQSITSYSVYAWLGGIKMDSTTINITVNAVPYCVLTVNTTTGGTVSISKDSVVCGTNTSVIATANIGYRFLNWTRSSTSVHISDSTNSSITVHKNDSTNGSITAHFSRVQYTLTINNTNQSSNINTGLVDSGTVYSLIATPNQHYYFDKWTRNNSNVIFVDTSLASTTIYLKANGTITGSSLQYDSIISVYPKASRIDSKSTVTQRTITVKVHGSNKPTINTVINYGIVSLGKNASYTDSTVTDTLFKYPVLLNGVYRVFLNDPSWKFGLSDTLFSASSLLNPTGLITNPK